MMETSILPAPTSVETKLSSVCSAAAWDCQSHSFLGSPQLVAENLAGLSDDLVQRRVYMLMVQGESRAEARIFERFAFGDTDASMSQWETDSLGDLVTEITDVLVANRGVHCPGEQVKAALGEGDRQFSVGAPAPAPKTAREAFTGALKAYEGDRFIRATVMVLC